MEIVAHQVIVRSRLYANATDQQDLYTLLQHVGSLGFGVSFIYDAPDFNSKPGTWAKTSSHLICHRPIGVPVTPKLLQAVEANYTLKFPMCGNPMWMFESQDLNTALHQHMTANKSRIAAVWNPFCATGGVSSVSSKLAIIFEQTPEQYEYLTVDSFYSQAYSGNILTTEVVQIVEQHHTKGWELAGVLEFPASTVPHPKKMGHRAHFIKLFFQAPQGGVAALGPSHPAGIAQPVSQPVAQPLAAQPLAAQPVAQPVAQPMAKPISQPKLMQVTVPAGVMAGGIFQVGLPSGQLVQVQVPPGVTPGQTMTIQV